MTEAACHPVIDRWHLAADGAAVAGPAGAQARGEESEPQPFNNRKAFAPRKADPFVLINP